LDCSGSPVTGLPAVFFRHFADPVAAAAGDATPTARRRFRKKGWEGSQSKELVIAVIFLCLTPLFGLRIKSYGGRKIDGVTAAVRGHGLLI